MRELTMKAQTVGSVSILLLLASVSHVVAQARPEIIRLTLDEAITRGLDASHRIGELRARQDAAEAATETRRMAERPQLALLGGYTRTSHIEEFGLVNPL